jgi:hypothetical protein
MVNVSTKTNVMIPIFTASVNDNVKNSGLVTHLLAVHRKPMNYEIRLSQRKVIVFCICQSTVPG